MSSSIPTRHIDINPNMYKNTYTKSLKFLVKYINIMAFITIVGKNTSPILTGIISFL
ncbi:hypothetical protein H477_0946 [[Clostridium] sordellii ATCC 9714]|nr:hypothetical protein H477_0946 [[Clostridium] sordellii ATCC 9714] [Paeniclostridium sordellii ATCC 9714]